MDTDKDAERQLFREAIGTVTPVKNDRRTFKTPRLTGAALKRHLTRHVYEAPSLEKIFDHSSSESVSAESTLAFQRTGLQEKQWRLLRRGALTPEASCDLHGLTQAQAELEMERFVENALAAGYRVIEVVHGKGNRSAQGEAVLKNWVNQYLRTLKAVLAFTSAPRGQGGTGAVWVLLVS